MTNANAFASVRILPSSAAIAATLDANNAVHFTLTQPGQFAIDFCPAGSPCTDDNDSDISNPLLIFANPLETMAPEPTASNVMNANAGEPVPVLTQAQNVIYFGPGVYDLGLTPYVLQANQGAYLAGGAYVKGFLQLAANANNVVVWGRGILSGEGFAQESACQPPSGTGCPQMIGALGSPSSTWVEGITVIRAPFMNIRLGGNSNRVDNVKVMAWHGNNDGILAAYGSNDSGSVIENSFFKTGDDAIHLTSSNLVVQNCVLWHLNNAAAFEFGANTMADLNNITVRNCDVIRTEHVYPNRDNAVFAGDQGGTGHFSNYVLQDINVENANWQLFKLALIGNTSAQGNTQLGSITNIQFKNIAVTQPQYLPDLFQSYNRVHTLSEITLDNVVVGGVTRPSSPVITVNVNRSMSMGGDITADLVVRSQATPTHWQIELMNLNASAGAAQYTPLDYNEPALPASLSAVGVGDFDGTGYASVLFYDAAQLQFGYWQQPALQGNATRFDYITLNRTIDGNQAFAGISDFNGDGYSDVALWNNVTQVAELLMLQEGFVVETLTITPNPGDSWTLAGVGDFDQNGLGDILLRDTTGNLGLVYLDYVGDPTVQAVAVASLSFTPTSHYTATWGPASGRFDTAWQVLGVADFSGRGYATILWFNPSTAQVGQSWFNPVTFHTETSNVFAQIDASTSIVGIGDYNADGVADLLLQNTGTGDLSFWYMGYFSGALYSVGPTLTPALATDWQNQPN